MSFTPERKCNHCLLVLITRGESHAVVKHAVQGTCLARVAPVYDCRADYLALSESHNFEILAQVAESQHFVAASGCVWYNLVPCSLCFNPRTSFNFGSFFGLSTLHDTLIVPVVAIAPRLR